MHASSGSLKLKQNIACGRKKSIKKGHRIKHTLTNLAYNSRYTGGKIGHITLFGATSLTLWKTGSCIFAFNLDSASCKVIQICIVHISIIDPYRRIITVQKPWENY